MGDKRHTCRFCGVKRIESFMQRDGVARNMKSRWRCLPGKHFVLLNQYQGHNGTRDLKVTCQPSIEEKGGKGE